MSIHSQRGPKSPTSHHRLLFSAALSNQCHSLSVVPTSRDSRLPIPPMHPLSPQTHDLSDICVYFCDPGFVTDKCTWFKKIAASRVKKKKQGSQAPWKHMESFSDAFQK